MQALFLAYLAPTLLMLAILTPPWQNPDEPFHMLRAVAVAHGELLGWRAWGSSGGLTDPAIYRAFTPVSPASMHGERRLDRATLARSGAVHWQAAASYAHFPNTVQYPPFFYLPDAAAYWAGRLAGLSVNRTLLLARCANALLFAATATGALALAGRTRPLLAAVLLLPTSLMLASSANQDSLMLAAITLAVALLDRACDAGRPCTRAESLAIAALLTASAMARPPYAAFLLLLWLTAPSGQRPPWRLMLGAATLTAAWCLAVALHVTVRLGGADLHAQLALLAAHPGRIAIIALHTLTTFGADYAVQMIGVLGWTDTRLPTPCILASLAVLGLAAIASLQGAPRRPWVAACGALFAVLAIFILQYLTWTWPGQPYVTGVLGRYFNPVVLVLALSLPAGRSPPLLRRVAWGATGTAALITPAIMLHSLIFRFYVG